MNKLQELLLNRNSPSYGSYYNGKMSYTLHGKEWGKYVDQAFPSMSHQKTSENIFKMVVDLYLENLIPNPPELQGFTQSLIPLLTRGEAPVIVDDTGTAHFPEHYEMISDGEFAITAVFTRSLREMKDYVTFVDSDGISSLWAKNIPEDLAPASTDGYQLIEERNNHTLIRFALPDKGLGASLAALQDRVNHSILDQTVIAEMYARPFWYLLNVELPPVNPYLPTSAQPDTGIMHEQKTSTASGRIFTSSSPGPFGQLEPPTIGDMISYHDSIIDKVSQTTGIPQFYFKPGTGTPPTGIALKTMTRRFMGRVSSMRDAIEPQLLELCDLLNVVPNDGGDTVVLWNQGDDLLQEALDTHGLSLVQMGYPLDYVAEVVTPGVNLDDYTDDGLQDALLSGQYRSE